MRVLGIDCGTEYTGYGVVELGHDGALVCLGCGAVKLSARDSLPARLSTIFNRLGEVIVEHRPDRVAIEDVFYALNVKSALKLGQVRGVAMLAASSAGLEVAEYSPLSIKSAVVIRPRRKTSGPANGDASVASRSDSRARRRGGCPSHRHLPSAHRRHARTPKPRLSEPKPSQPNRVSS